MTVIDMTVTVTVMTVMMMVMLQGQARKRTSAIWIQNIFQYRSGFQRQIMIGSVISRMTMISMMIVMDMDIDVGSNINGSQ